MLAKYCLHNSSCVFMTYKTIKEKQTKLYLNLTYNVQLSVSLVIKLHHVLPNKSDIAGEKKEKSGLENKNEKFDILKCFISVDINNYCYFISNVLPGEAG